ncbi:unnamed protein product [Hermetia illucens]|uniref:Cytochrome P450 n=1 Tax=Hermetia illucens TaxID=343691 RepID=A0A7R8YSK2_HERIL|nr:unnamed protein product [Hermetia illucens]
MIGKYYQNKPYQIAKIIACYGLYRWAVAKHDHFLKRGIDHDKPLPFFGTFKNLYLRADSHFGVVMKQYEKYKHKSYFGIYEHRNPILVVSDPSLIRQITVTDFDHFMNHGDMFNSTTIQDLTFAMPKDNKWKNALAATTFGMRPNSVSFKENMFFNQILGAIDINPMLYVIHLK